MEVITTPRSNPGDRRVIWLENLRDEREGIALYAGLAEVEKDPERARTFAELADAERRHAAVWVRKLEKAGVPLPPEQPSARTRFLVWMARRWGTGAVLPMVMANESHGVAKYARQGGESAALVGEEQEHGDTLRRLSGRSPFGARELIAERERFHRGNHAGTLRAAVFGMNDGLVSNLSLVLGVAAAGASTQALFVTGLAGLFAGAFSMAVGEYVSVAGQRDVLRRQVTIERNELAEAPEEEEAELSELLQSKGLSAQQAQETARQIMVNPESALDTLVREELGLDPHELGSPWKAALSSFLMFAFGAGLPLIPLGLSDTRAALAASATIGASVLGVAGAFIGFLAGNSALRSGLRMLGLGALAAGVTVAIGRLVGSTLG